MDKTKYKVALKVRNNILTQIIEYERIRCTMERDGVHSPAVSEFLNGLRADLKDIDLEIDDMVTCQRPSSAPGPRCLRSGLEAERKRAEHRSKSLRNRGVVGEINFGA